MRNPGGYLIITDPGSLKSDGRQSVREWDTITCNHCNGLFKIVPQDDTFLCKKCMKYVCPTCGGKPGCLPFEEKLRIYEEQVRRGIERTITLKSYGVL